MIPQFLARYEIRGQLGKGGMASVYLAYDPNFAREVAIKVLPPQFLHDSTFLKRFRQEAQTIAALEHFAVVPVYDFGEHNGQPFLVMRLMTGGSLADRLAKGALSLAEATHILATLAPTLDEAHRLGIIHRDLKPPNILFDQRNMPRIADFGIAKLTLATQSFATSGIIGTPQYMSPEQWEGLPLDGRCDVYALGVLFFQMLAGQCPYEGTTPGSIMKKHLMNPVPNILSFRQDLPPSIQPIIEQAMSKERDYRYATASELVAALKPLLSSSVRTTVVKQISPAQARPPVISLPTAATHLEAGNRYYQQGNYDGAIAEYSRALLLDSNSSPGYLYRAVVYHIKGQFDKAIPDYNQAIRLNASDPKAYYYRGLAYSNTGQLVDAIGDYDHALHLKADYTDAANNRQTAVAALMARAQTSYQQGRLDEAITDCTTLLRLNPREVTVEVSALVLRGQCYYQKGQLDDALADYDQALRLNPHHKEAQKHHKVAYQTKHPPLGIGSERVCAKDGMVQVYVPAGKFKMGSPPDEPDARDNEKPQHEVYLDAYWIDKTPVTNAMFSKFVQETGYKTEAEKEGSAYIYGQGYVKGAQWRHPKGPNSNLSGKDNHPVVCVSWNDAVAYAKWAERRLPTEAEWEKAAGGTDERKWPWGNEEPTPQLCNFNSNVGDTTPVDKYPAGASPYGALDMAGNVWEWCHDTFDANYYASSPNANPTNESPARTKVLRGGSWFSVPCGTPARVSASGTARSTATKSGAFAAPAHLL